MPDHNSDDETLPASALVRTPPVSPHIDFAEKVYGRPVKAPTNSRNLSLFNECALFVNDSIQNTNVLILASLAAMHKLWYPGDDDVEDFQKSILLLLDGRPSSKNIKTALNKIIDPDHCSHLDPDQFGYWPKCLSPHVPFQTNVTISTSPGLSNAAFFYIRILDSLLTTLANTTVVDSSSGGSDTESVVLSPVSLPTLPSTDSFASFLTFLQSHCPILMSQLSSVFATSVESEVDNLTTTVTNHFIGVINTITSRPNPPVVGSKPRWTDFDKTAMRDVIQSWRDCYIGINGFALSRRGPCLRIVYIAKDPLPKGSTVFKTLKAPGSFLGPAGLLTYTSAAECRAVPPLHLTDPYSLEVVAYGTATSSAAPVIKITARTTTPCLTYTIAGVPTSAIANVVASAIPPLSVMKFPSPPAPCCSHSHSPKKYRAPTPSITSSRIPLWPPRSHHPCYTKPSIASSRAPVIHLDDGPASIIAALNMLSWPMEWSLWAAEDHKVSWYGPSSSPGFITAACSSLVAATLEPMDWKPWSAEEIW
ncbi:hypothetical protein BC829DRAFT_444734 [Chytridium lagenaria]|nr:hypothetical protein BC829DRAFT_444734 [Chytridium lagenaria]